MRLLKYLLIGLFFTMFITGCGQASPDEEEALNDPTPGAEEDVPEEVVEPDEYPQFRDEVEEGERIVKMVTNKGDITIKLFPEYAPLAVENFLTHSENGYYDGVLFHRVIEGFMIQTGDPLGNGTGGESIWGNSFEDEFSPELAHFKGALSMANRGPNTNGSQFFIVHSETVLGGIDQHDLPEGKRELYIEHGGTPHLDFGHTVFGQVVEGMDVVDAIAEAETGANDRPVDDIVIERIEVIN